MPYQYTDALDDELLYERCESFGGGMDAFNRATLLAADQYQYGENIILPDSLQARTRPGADSLGGAGVTPAGVPNKKIQGLFYFDTNTYEQLVAGSNDKLWKWEGAAWAEMVGFGLTAASIVEIAQGIDKLLITDGTQNMRSWDGAAFVDLGNVANTNASDPPVGAKILCWHAGRMFASGKPTANDTVWASSLLDFGTGKWDHLQFSFRVGGGEGEPIIGMASMQDFWLGVLKENSTWLVNTDPTAASAALWPARRVSQGSGLVGKKAWCQLGNDLLFVTREGVRSMQRMVSAAGQYELSPPISQPLQPYFDRINWTYGSGIAVKAYKHLAFFAVPLDASTYNNYVLVWNGRLQRWVGVWTGWSPLFWEVTRFAGVLRLVLGENSGAVRQWKDYADATDDATYKEDGADIASKLWTRSFLFGEPVNDKDGYHNEVRFFPSNAIVNLTLTTDGADLFTWTEDMRTSGQALPVDLPFDLDNPQSVTARRGLRGRRPFNEAFLKIESAAGWWALRNVTLSAYLNTLRNQ